MIRQNVNPLPSDAPLVDPKTGFATISFQTWWQSLFQNSETAFDDIDGKANAGPIVDSGLTESSQTILGRVSALVGPIEELTLGGDLEFSGSTVRGKAYTGDATKAAGGTVLTFATVNSNVGTFGDSSHVSQITVNAKGLITAAANVAISAGAISGGAALTKADDTNVTLTLTGTPATALLQAVTVTAGWTGTLALSRGGTAASTAAGARANILPSFTSNALKFLRVNSAATDAEWAPAGIYAPLVNGTTPGPVLMADPLGQCIMAPI